MATLVDIISAWFGKNKKPTLAPLSAAATKKTPPKVTTASPQQIQLINTAPEDTLNPSNNLLAILNNPQTAFSVKEITLKKIEDATLLAELAAHHKIAKIRQQAAKQLNDFSLIQKVASQVKHSDKSVYRLLRQKIDAQEQQQKAQQKHTHSATQICIDLENLLNSAHTPLFAAKVQSLQQHWQHLSEQKAYSLITEIQQRFNSAITQAQEKVAAENAQKTLLEQHTKVAVTVNPLQEDIIIIDDSIKINGLQQKPNALSQTKVNINKPHKATTSNTSPHPEFEKLITQITEEFNQGHSREAEKILRNAQKYAKAHQIFDHRLNQWLEELQKMKDWAGFAILPKKEQLLAQMKQLAERVQNTTDPLTHLDNIKLLQAQWQALGSVYSEAEKTLWDEFKALSHTAYAPCQQYFDKQNTIQAQNAIAREQLCDELQHYLDNLPNNINWHGHIAILKKARADWQRYHPVEAKKHKQLQEKFTIIIKALEDKLHAEYEIQEANKKALIAEVAQLINHENIHEACQQAKALQNTWKTLGFCGHQKEQVLWDTFRQSCDALFAKRNAHFEAQKNQQQATIEQAEHILAEINTLLNTPEHVPNSKQVNPLIETFKALLLPKEVNYALRKRFTKLNEQWQQSVDTQINRQKQAQLTQIEIALDLCVSAEQDKLSGKNISLSLVLTWQGLTVPQPFKTALQKRWQSISSLKKMSLEALAMREQKALDACLLLELLLDLDSPESDRMAQTAKKMALFEQQSYPKTVADTQALVNQTLQNLLLMSGLEPTVNKKIKQRLQPILRHPIVFKLI